MAKFKYVGDHQRGDCLGYQFPRGIGVQITNEAHIKKLSGNPHFEEVKAEPAEKPSAPKPKKSAEKVTNGDEGADQAAGLI